MWLAAEKAFKYQKKKFCEMEITQKIMQNSHKMNHITRMFAKPLKYRMEIYIIVYQWIKHQMRMKEKCGRAEMSQINAPFARHIFISRVLYFSVGESPPTSIPNICLVISSFVIFHVTYVSKKKKPKKGQK